MFEVIDFWISVQDNREMCESAPSVPVINPSVSCVCRSDNNTHDLLSCRVPREMCSLIKNTQEKNLVQKISISARCQVVDVR